MLQFTLGLQIIYFNLQYINTFTLYTKSTVNESTDWFSNLEFQSTIWGEVGNLGSRFQGTFGYDPGLGLMIASH